MSDQSKRRRFRARYATVRAALLVEFVGITLMVAGALLLLTGYRRGNVLAKTLVDPRLWLLVLLVSALGTFSTLAFYYLGKRGKEEIFERFPQLEGERWERIEAAFQRWGARALILSGVPGVGTVLPAAAGVFNIKRSAFLLWVFLGKMLRNWLLVLILLPGWQFLKD
jgi:membrane protein YqaA with SNARE-associated domain